MLLKAIIRSLNKRANIINQTVCALNISSAGLNGVAVTIPDDVPAPAVYFKGRKVLLHNVSYDHEIGCIRATITLPYKEEAGTERGYSGGHYRYKIDDNWFK